LEVIFFLLVLTLTAGMVVPLVLGSSRTSAQVAVAEAGVRSTVDAIDQLGALARRIQPPLWANGATLATSEGTGFRVRYWDGAYDQILELKTTPGGVVEAKAGGQTWRWGPWKGTKVLLWIVDHRPVGIVWQGFWAGENRTVRVSWGAQCL
jgi:hypothetical protein